MNNRIIFLDIDGVCNSHQHFLMTEYISETGIERMNNDTCLHNLWNLKFILKNVPDLKIVISSTWREVYSFESIKSWLKFWGISKNRVIGKTPVIRHGDRAEEIKTWINENKVKGTWLVLDDHPVFQESDPVYKNFYQTDNRVGLTYVDSIKIITRFEPNFREPIILM